jgi:hypothetical protein
VLDADGMWYEVVFDLSDSAMTLVGGAGTLASTLDNVIEMRILSSASPAWIGDDIAGALGVDNIAFDGVLFVDGFENGDVTAWSSSVPRGHQPPGIQFARAWVRWKPYRSMLR